MPTPNYPEDGLNSLRGVPHFGMPVSLDYPGGLGLAGYTTGNIFYVDSTHSLRSDNTSSGRSPNEPFATIDYAIGQCTANNGDVIFVLPGHTETVSAAGGITFDVAGVSVIGLGQGSDRGLISTATATTADIEIDAANVTIANLRFNVTLPDGIDAPFDIDAAGFKFIGCDVEFADGTGQADLVMLSDANANGIVVKGCYFHGSANAGTATVLRFVSGDDIFVVDNVFLGNFTTTLGAIDNTTASINFNVFNNYIDNRTASAAVAMTFAATTTGMIGGNRMQVLTGTAPIVGAAMSWVGGNYYAAVIATAGTLI